MTSRLRKYAKTIIVLILMIGSIISMLILKQAYEQDRDSDLEDQFKIAQLVLVLTIAYVIFSFLFNRWKEYKVLKDSHAQAQLDLLKSKMDPHFFFNTLNNLYGLAIEKSDETAPIILKLSEVMRYTIYNGDKEYIPLSNEIEHLKQYIEIHRIRYKHHLDIQINENLLDREVKVTPLLFINLLENAFKHGVETMTEDAYIKINIEGDEKRLVFEIENNMLYNNSTEDGRGLTDLKERLKLTYPKKHTFEIEQTATTFFARLVLQIK